MGELLWAFLVLLWSLGRLAFCGVLIYGFLTGRLVWRSKSHE